MYELFLDDCFMSHYDISHTGEKHESDICRVVILPCRWAFYGCLFFDVPLVATACARFQRLFVTTGRNDKDEG